jgi:hypothetical protein
MNRFNFVYFRNQKTIHQKLSTSKKRLASTNRIRRLEIVRKYKNLQRTFKHQQMNQWLLNWEKIYAKRKRLNLSDVQKDRCAYDFLNALRTIDLSFLFDKKTTLNHEMNQNKSSTSIRDLLKKFRNYLRIARTLITKKSTHETFENCKKNRSMIKRLIKKINQRNLWIAKSRIVLVCVTENICSKTVIIWSRKFNRLNENRIKKSNQKKINKILEANSRFRIAVKYAKKKVKKWLEKDKKIENFDDKSTQTSKKIILNVSFAEIFVEKKNLIQADQLLNIEQRDRHSCLQRFRTILIKSNDWLWESVNNR